MSRTIVIVGANLAGGTAASTLRREGFEGRVVLIGDEPDPPYERPPLSKEYLRGESDFESALLSPADFYADQEIDLMLGTRATALDLGGRVVKLETGERLPYDSLLLTTGGRNRKLRVPGADLQNIFDLRTRPDADAIREAAGEASHAVVVGMGFIGAEVAASLRHQGMEVTAIEPFPVPLMRVLGARLGRVVADLHADQGVQLVLGDTVTGFVGSSSVEAVRTESGRTVEGDLVVVGVGIEPNVELAVEAGLDVDNGIVVDELCRTSGDDVFAAGDVANHFHPMMGRHMRVEHWQNAIRQAAAAARSMIGQRDPYREVHWFWSDQYDTNIQYAGFHGDPDETVTRGDVSQRDFIVFHLAEGKLHAAIGFNRRRDVRAAMRLIASEKDVSPAELADEEVELKSLLRS